MHAPLNTPSPRPTTVDWEQAGYRYFAYNLHLRSIFGQRVQKVSIDAGFTCPNVDGTVAIGGCTFCDNRSFSPSRRIPRQDIHEQIDEGIRGLRRRYKCDQFIAYFQPATNTYAAVELLEPLYRNALDHEDVVGLSIGTRPDCVEEDVLELLEQLDTETYLSVEYGMQTMHDRSLDWMNRGHHHDVTRDAVRRSHKRGLSVCLHIILGLPGETHEEMMETAREVAALGVDAVKIHNLYAVRNTPLAEQVQREEVELMGLEEYARTVVEFLELLPRQMVVERISGDAPPDFLVGPEWCLDKSAVLAAIDGQFQQRESCQGKKYSAPADGELDNVPDKTTE
jgi:radical SAM protein (TIGR01212 family)